ncbi:unnamed protein product [Adineta ricciae]|uniref:MAM domain-containing protein n=1 Tax=Adineta ricciae TaxID=249248 RepID=A0A815IYT9_ADIRI|nr:unnamed protein product [Adineta ricciae]
MSPLILFILLSQTFLSQGAILNCDFETDCKDFYLYDLAKTDGYNPQPIDHDHTLNIKAGHYIYYTGTAPRGLQIQAYNWLEPSTDRPLCFRMWYYSSRIEHLFSVQTAQGEGQELMRTLASVLDKNASTVDWTLIDVKLPNEKIKINVKTYITQLHLTFDDISVDYCDGQLPPPPKVLYTCDFESSCSNDFVTLPIYEYQWLISTATNARRIEWSAPTADYTFGNSSGHYAFVPVSNIVGNGKVGYIHLKKQFQITSEESYCLNFQYYVYPTTSYASHLRIYSWASDESKAIKVLWPKAESAYHITGGRWGWGIINLPVGNYSLLFRVDTSIWKDSFALDNIDIISCDYPPSFTPYDSLLSFSCNFDTLTMCEMMNDKNSTLNFTTSTGDTIPDQELGPARDHTHNSTSAGFLYWNQNLSAVSANDRGRVYLSKKILQNTVIRLSSDESSSTVLWYQVLSDSQGWQIALVPLTNITSAITYSFEVYRLEPTLTAVAFDDIEIDQCSSVIPTTTSTLTTLTSTSTTTTPTTTTTYTSTIIITTTTTTTTTTTLHNNAPQLFPLNTRSLIIYFFLVQIFRHFY